MGQNTRQEQNLRATARDSTGQNTLNPRIAIKISDSAGNLTRAAGLDGKEFTVHVTAMDKK